MNWFKRRDFLKTSGLGLMGAAVVGPPKIWPDERAMSRAEQHTDSFVKLREEQRRRKHELPEPADFFRLPLEWHQNKAREVKAEARQRGVDGGLLLTNRWNLHYLGGLFHSTTQRPFAAFFPMDDDDACIWFYPYLDEPLVEREPFWATGGHYYFCYPHAEGGFPNHDDPRQGRTVNLHRWWGETLAEMGYGNRTIGIDALNDAMGILPGQEDAERLDLFGDYDIPQPYRPEGGMWGRVATGMSEARFVDVGDILIKRRVVKDEMEQRLTQLAMDYWSEIHAFARNYLIERGLGATDWEVANAAQMWGMHRIMQDIPQRGEPHVAVGISPGTGCRSGRVTAYPHPNQTRWSRIERGHAIQFAGVTRIGGYGGEQYRSFLVAPWTDWQERVWEAHTESYFIQAEESRVGNTCSNVAKAVHDHQVAAGMGHLSYHRPGHGAGMEGHQPPFHSLGDYTVLQKGMMFSNEPGLYDPENGFGFNHSNNILTWDDRGLQTGTAPCNKEWCFLSL
jgi:Xaa-Pro dipeptidase